MTLVLRSVKGSKLTISEMDNNLLYLQSLSGSSSGNPSGIDTQIQYNENGSFGASSAFTYNYNTKKINLDGSFSATNLVTGYVFSNPKTIEGIINVPDNSNAFLIGPDISIAPGSDIILGENSDLIVFDPNDYFFTGNTSEDVINEIWVENLYATQNIVLSGSVSANTYYGDGSNLTGVISETNFVTKTKAEIDSLIQTNTLVPSQMYKITGVDVELYGGTDILIQAETLNKLSLKCKGIFYNPQYDQFEIGYGIWTKYMNASFENQSGLFYENEYVVSDQGDVATFMSNGFLEYVSGTWTGATQITGQSSNVYCDVVVNNVPKYELGDSVIWGGKKWNYVFSGNNLVTGEVILYGDNGNYYEFSLSATSIVVSSVTISDGIETFYTTDLGGNLTGDLGGYGDFNYGNNEGYVSFNSNVSSGTPITISYEIDILGTSIDKYTLDDKWQPIEFNQSDYNLVVDEIEYDYEHDKIICRKDRFNNEVNLNYITLENFTDDNALNFGNPIKDFQWGNAPDNFGFDSGIFFFNDVEYTPGYISDGGWDMFDDGNGLKTDLYDPIPYTHTTLDNNTYNDYYPILPSDLPMDGTVQSGDTYFGNGSSYFTNLYPGLFIMVADNTTVNEFGTIGNLGADEYGFTELDSYTLTGYSETYTIYVKKVYGQEDPSVNHIMIINNDGSGVEHTYDDQQEDDIDTLTNISASTKIYYLLSSKYPNPNSNTDGLISKEVIDNMVINFLDMVDGHDINETLAIINSGYTNITSLLPPPQIQEFKGVFSNKIIDSYFDCLNFLGGYIYQNELKGNSYFRNNIFAPSTNSGFYRNTIDNSYVFANVFSNYCEIIDNNLSQDSEISQNLLGLEQYNDPCIISNNNLVQNSEIKYNNLVNSFINNCNLDNSSSINNNSMLYSSIEYNNLGLSSDLDFNYLYHSYIYWNKLDNSYMSQNYLTLYANIEHNDLNGESQINNNDLLSSTINKNILSKNSIINENFLNNSYVYENSLKNNSSISVNNLLNIISPFFEYSNIYKNNLSQYSSINFNNLTASSIYINILEDESQIEYNSLSISSYYNNNVIINNSSIDQNNLLDNSAIRDNSLNNNCYINNNNLDSSSIYNGYFNNESYMDGNELQNSSFNQNRIENSSQMESNNIINTNFSFNRVINSSLNGNNSTGSTINHNSIIYDSSVSYNTIHSSEITNNEILHFSIFEYNYFSADTSVQFNRIENNSNITNLSLGDSTLKNNLIHGSSSLSNVSYEISSIEDNSIRFGSEISNISLYDSEIKNNEIKHTSSISDGIINYGLINNNFLNQESIISNFEFITCEISFNESFKNSINLTNTGSLNTKNIKYLDAKNCVINENLSGATIIYGDYPKNIFKNSASVARISYYDASDLLVIGNVTD